MTCSLHIPLAEGQRATVSVNGIAIPHAHISREVQNHPAKTAVAAWRSAARALVVRELLVQEARRLGIKASPTADEEGRRETDEEALISALLAREVEIPEADEAACRRYYERNHSRFRSRDLYEVAHILIAARRDRPEAYAGAHRRAHELLARIIQAQACFADLARAYSDCPSARSGGNLGQLSAGDTTPEFEEALMTLEPGQMTDVPIETRYGFHIIRLKRRIEGRELPFELVHEQIAGYLTERSWRTAVAQFVARLAARAEIAGVDLPDPADLRVT